MSGVYGWSGASTGDPRALLASMRGQATASAVEVPTALIGARAALGASAPAGAACTLARGAIRVAWHGHPAWRDATHSPPAAEAFGERLIDRYRATGPAFLAELGGDFALALIDESRNETLLAVDRMGIRNLVYAVAEDLLVFGPGSGVLRAHPAIAADVEAQALYNYVYFHMVPGPGTAFVGHARLLPAQYLLARGREVVVRSYWTPSYSEESQRSVRRFAPALRQALRDGVGAFSAGRCGAFLSGGTDSSTVAGVLTEVTGQPAPTYSIGFDATGYDEMEYARITARHFATDHHEYYVTPADVVAAIPLVAAAYDQPFGNASAIPTYFCARLARADGIERILGGDGGDELFGGNDRYAKQYQFSLYGRVPAPLRSLVVEPLLRGIPGAGRVPLLAKARSYVAQANLPMPQRYESYNLLERLGPANVFDADFLASVDRHRPESMLKAAYDSARAESLINRMLALDLQFTLADNDLPKVTRMCDAAGVDVAFPLLHEAVFDFAATLPPDWKLRGTRLRYFFKEALRGFLPDATLSKTKHGFGLPTGTWLRSHPPLRELAGDTLGALKRRGIVRAELIDGLLTTRLASHAGYYGTLAWILMMLELWFQQHVDRSGRAAAQPR